MKRLLTNYWGRCSRRCILKKYALLFFLLVVGNLLLHYLHLRGIGWGFLVGIISGCATWFIPYEAVPDIRPNDKGLKIAYFDIDKGTITINGRLLSENVHPNPGDDTGHDNGNNPRLTAGSGGQCDSGSSPRIAGLLPAVSGQPKHEGVG